MKYKTNLKKYWKSEIDKFGSYASGAMQVEPPLAGEITQALDAIPWVRCASGNVSHIIPFFSLITILWLLRPFDLFDLVC